jgi:ribosomal protein S18 acetylase RimI-like enzyme
MPCELRFLSKADLPDVYATFVEAFADYAVDMRYNTEPGFAHRAVKNGVEFGSSVGAYAGGRMVGFTLVGVDDWRGTRCAFDAMTGIVKSHRGQGIAGKMFDAALPKLKAAGIKEFWLEVLQSNAPAIKAYQRTGFRTVREFDCFQARLEAINPGGRAAAAIEIQAIERADLPLYAAYLDWQPSWENSLAAIGRIPDEVLLLGARYAGERAGVLVYYPTLSWIMCLAVARPYRRKGVASALLRALKLKMLERLGDSARLIKMIGVEHADDGMLRFLKQAGFEVYTSLYEMRMELA